MTQPGDEAPGLPAPSQPGSGRAGPPIGRSAGNALAGRLLLVVAAGFVVVALVRNWDAVREDLRLLAWPDLLASGLAGASAVALTGLSWRLVLRGLGGEVPLHDAMRVYFAAQLGKYVPGSVWVVALQAEMGRTRGVPRAVIALSYLVSILLAVATGGAVGLLALLGAAGDSTRALALAPVVAATGVVVLLALIRPTLPNRAIGWLATRIGRDLPALAIPGRALAGAVLLMVGAWSLFGLHAWLLARPLGAGVDLLAPTTGAFALAFVAGILLVPLPAGAGVREGILVAMLAGSIGASAALTVSLLSRLLLILVDLVLAAAFGVLRVVASVRASPPSV